MDDEYTVFTVRRRRRDPVPRFWAKVNKGGPIIRPELGPCWVWTAFCGVQGYGVFGVGHGRNQRAHRYSWFLSHGEVPTLDVLHRCDNPPCVRPEHLFLGDDMANVKDRKAKGRGGNHKGTANGRCRLTEDQVREIRRLYGERIIGPTALAQNYGVSLPTIWYALKRGWSHLT